MSGIQPNLKHAKSRVLIDRLEDRRMLQASLVKDSNTTPSSETMHLLGQVGDVVLFAQNDGIHGTELWRSDGTSAGTYMLVDAAAGPNGSAPSSLNDAGGLSYFDLQDEQGNHALWRTDGTKIGTIKLKQITAEGNTADLKGSLYFRAYDKAHGMELWKSNGTVNGTKRVRDLHPGEQSGVNNFELIQFGNALYFEANDGVQAIGLWRTDGTFSGTYRVDDTDFGSDRAQLQNLRIKDDTLLFSSVDPANNYAQQDWTSDGQEITLGITSMPLVFDERELLGKTYTIRSDGSLWRIDGTSSGTKRLAESGFIRFMEVERSTSRTNRLYAKGEVDGDYLGFMIRGDKLTRIAINDGIQVGNYLFSSPDELEGAGLRRTDGTPLGTVELSPYNFDGFHSLGDDLIFFTGDGLFRGAVSGDYYDPNVSDVILWKTDGTVSGTKQLKHFPGSTNIGLFDWYNNFSWDGRVVGDKLYFFLTDDTHGTELHYTDGTTNGTRLVRDSFAGTESSEVSKPVQGPNGTYFAANGIWLRENDGNLVELIHEQGKIAGTLNGQQAIVTNTGLWMSDGTVEGTHKIFRLPSKNLDNSFLLDAGVLGNTIYFGKYVYTIGDNNSGDRFYFSDGTSQGTRRTSRSIAGLAYKDRIISYQRYTGQGIVATNLQGENQVILKDDLPDYPKFPNLFEAAGKVYFGVPRANEFQIWRTDGTLRGTKKPGVLTSERGDGPEIAAIGNTLYLKFSRSLWKFDLVSGQPKRLATFDPNGRTNEFICTAGNRVFFSATDERGAELWVSDGTSAGTRIVKDINPDGDSVLFTLPDESDTEESSDVLYATDAAAFGDTLYFTADDGKHGRELWKSDGTSAGTVMVEDIYPGIGEPYHYPGGPNSAWPQNLAVVGSTLLFSAADSLHGRELWQLSLD